MNDVTQQCVSLASGTLSPDLRVDYQFGLVLGVNEFRQEQEYFLEKDYLYNRELHGYGTVSGLKVTAAQTQDNLNDALITVDPGMALDQWGRPVVIRNPQCARLGAWLAKREQQNPGEIASHRGASDDFHLYVVVSYDECEDALVPIPGQPCSSGDALQAPSRIRDSFNIGLRWEPPSMPAWDAVRCFAKLMAQVRIVPELALNLSDEDTIIEHVRQLDQPCPDDFFSSPPMGSPPDQFFQLPAVTARDALDRIFTVWVTEVRPKPELLPNLIDPGTSEAGILLARIDFTYAPDTKAITLLGPSPDNTDDDGRPFLLHTQLIQELLLLGSGEEVQVIHEPSKVEREFATLQVRDGHTLRAWVHHPDIVVIPPGTSADWSQILELKNDGVVLSIQDVSQGSDAASMNVFEITINSFDNDRPQLIVTGARVELTFKVAGFQVQSGGSLQDSIDALDFDYVGHDRTANTITAYTIADHLPVREFVTFNTVMNAGIAQLTLWFHDQQVNLTASPGAVQVLRGVGNQPISFNLNSGGAFSFLWDLSAVQTSFGDKDFLSFSFDTNAILIGDDANSKTLTSFIRDQQVSLVGYDGDHTIQAFYEVDIPPQGDDSLSQPAQPFVTITPATPATPQSIFELWFHLNLVPEQNTVVIRKLSFQVFAELDQAATGPVGASIQSTPQRNVFNITLDPASWEKFKNSPYLRFVFPLQENFVRTPQVIPLGDYIRNTRIKFDGFNGKDSIIVYVRVPQAIG